MTPLTEKLILHWGEMGSRWGVNRSIAQVQAFLFVAGRPVDADELVQELSISRSNVSMSLKELQQFGLVKLVHKVGERREFFESVGQPWDMFLQIVEARRQREVQPTLDALKALVAESRDDRETPEAIKQRILELSKFGDELDGWYREIRRLPMGTIRSLLRMGAKVARFIPGERDAGDPRRANQEDEQGTRP